MVSNLWLVMENKLIAVPGMAQFGLERNVFQGM